MANCVDLDEAVRTEVARQCLRCLQVQLFSSMTPLNRELNYLRMNHRIEKITLFHWMNFK